jgi:outer membrane protein
LATPPGSAAQPSTLTLSEALRRALAANPGLARARSEVAVAEAQLDQTKSAVLPKVSLSGNLTRNSDEASFGSGSDQRILLPATDWNYRLTVAQPIWAGNRDRRALSQSRLAIESARQGAVDSEEQLLLNVAADYLSVIEGEQLIAVEQSNLELARRRQKQATDLFEAGETTRVEALRAEADVKASERRLAEVRQLRENAVGRLRLDLALDGPLNVTDPADQVPAPPTEQALLIEADRSRPEVAQAQTALEIARLEVAKQRGALLPVVTGEGGWIDQKSPFPTDTYGYLTLRVNVPIYQGGEVAARVETAREHQRQAELRLAEVRQQVREEVRQALVDLETSRASLALSQEQLTAAEAEYAQASELYRAQEITALESESAETSLAAARRAVVTSNINLRIAQLRVWSAAGVLKNSFFPEDAR